MQVGRPQFLQLGDYQSVGCSQILCSKLAENRLLPIVCDYSKCKVSQVHTHTQMLFLPISIGCLEQKLPFCIPLSLSRYVLLLFSMCCYCSAVILHVKVLCWLSVSGQVSLPSKLLSMLQSNRKKVSTFSAAPMNTYFGLGTFDQYILFNLQLQHLLLLNFISHLHCCILSSHVHSSLLTVYNCHSCSNQAANNHSSYEYTEP